MRWIFFFLFISSTAIGQRFIQGKIVDKENGKPVAFASVGIIGEPRGTSSNIDGEFSLSVPNAFSLRVTCLGYESITLNSVDSVLLIELKPIATQLEEVVILYRQINPRKLVKRAFDNIAVNFNDKSFLQKFFYRQYSKEDDSYERLIEASVDVWKERGYKKLRVRAGDKESLRINQLRRSLDIKGMVQGQTPIFLNNILQTDIVSYQQSIKKENLSVFDEVSNLKIDVDRYAFSFNGITRYDGQEVYVIKYTSPNDSILTTSGYIKATTVTGTLFITTDTYAFVKTEEVRDDGINTIKSSAYYLKHQDNYYPYHLIREGENKYHKSTSSFHIELMAVEISHNLNNKFSTKSFDRSSLLDIAYDSSYWKSFTILKTTPLEDKIIRGLGGGQSLNKQFYLYKQYELNVTNGGINGEEKFAWLRNDSKGKRALYLCFWNSGFNSISELLELENIKRLNRIYKNTITFVLLSLEDDETKWRQSVNKYNFFADGIINYRIGSSSMLEKSFNIKQLPAFILISKSGDVNLNAKNPSNPLLEQELKDLAEN